MTAHADMDELRAQLEWHIELGAGEAIGETPVDRYAAAEAAALRQEQARAKREKAADARIAALDAPAQPAAPRGVDPAEAVAIAERAAAAAGTLEELRAAMEAFDLCDLREGARQLVFADGNPGAEAMIVGEAPGRDEDREGKPFVGRAGQLLDRMLEAAGLSRSSEDPGAAVYITNVLPWRPPGNRDPSSEEIAMLRPFVARHVALAGPRVLMLMGNISCFAALDRRGITRLRGNWVEAWGVPALPAFHPAYLLRNPQAKREAWSDMLEFRARLRNIAQG